MRSVLRTLVLLALVGGVMGFTTGKAGAWGWRRGYNAGYAQGQRADIGNTRLKSARALRGA